MADFGTIVDKTLTFEGGYQAFANDSANYTSQGQLVGTNKGVSAIAYETYLGYPPTVAQMQAITTPIAKDVYKKLFWDKMQGDQLVSDSVAWIMFDSYIATGSLALSREGVNDAGGSVVTTNTPFNQFTLDTVNNLPPVAVFDAVKQRNIAQRQYLAATDPNKYGQFLQGWLNRLNAITFEDIVQGAKKAGPVIVVLLVAAIGFYYLSKKRS